MINGSKDNPSEIKDLAIRPVEEQALIVRELAATSGRRAEDALMAIAVHGGDQAIMQVLEQLNPIEIGKIIGQHDFSIPSITGWLVEPQKIVEMLSMAPNDWQRVRENTRFEDILTIQEEALNLLSVILLTEDNSERIQAVLNAIMQDEAAFFFFCFPFIGQDAVMNLTETSIVDWTTQNGLDSDDIDVQKGSQPDSNYRQQLYELFYLVEKIVPEMAAKMRQFIDYKSETASVWGVVFKSIVELREMAMEKIKAGDKPVDDDFEDMGDMFDTET